MTLKKLGLPILAIIMILVMLSLMLFIKKNGKYNLVYTNSFPNKQIVIDPGHGGEDGGAVANDLVEKDLNLEISLILADMLRESGFEVILTRDSDISIYDEGEQSLKNKKRSDIMNRLKLANENPSSIFVSIHQNKFEESKYSGAQMFYGLKNEFSKPLALSLQKSIVNMLQPNNNREIKPITSSVYLINNASSPAVLCECGFLSNSDEAKLLSNKEYQSKISFAIMNGILNFYKDKDQIISEN